MEDTTCHKLPTPVDILQSPQFRNLQPSFFAETPLVAGIAIKNAPVSHPMK